MEILINDALPVGTILKSSKCTYKIEKVLGIVGFGIKYKVSSKITVDTVDSLSQK